MRGTQARASLRLAMLLLDAAVVFGSILLSYVIRLHFLESDPIYLVWDKLSWVTPLVILAHIVSLWLFGLYDIRRTAPLVRTFLTVAFAVLLAFTLMVVVFYVLPEERIGPVVFATHVVIAVLGIFLVRLLLRSLVVQRTRSERLLVIGTCEGVEQLCDDMKEAPYPKQDIVGLFSLTEKGLVIASGDNEGDAIKDGLLSLVRSRDATRVLVMPDADLDPEIRSELVEVKYAGLAVSNFAGYYSQVLRKLPLAALDDLWFVHSDRTEFFQDQIFTKIKRLVDIAVSLLSLLVLWPLLLFISILIKLNSPRGPVLFKQERLSQNRVPFTLLKFRTMIPDAEKKTGPTWSSEKDPRIFFIGRILRRLRLDELPQLLNILRGQMSLIGPRPIREHFADKMQAQVPFYNLRFKVKPGLTGWAQVNHTYAGSEDEQYEKTKYDLYYVQSASPILELRIILMTIRTMLRAIGQ